MDLLDGFSRQPLEPSYDPHWPPTATADPASPSRWLSHPGGLVEIGVDASDPGTGFHFDNEGPRHRVWLEPFPWPVPWCATATTWRSSAMGATADPSSDE